MHDEHQVPIWFFIGGMLSIYGVLILGAGLYSLAYPPPPPRIALYEYHADVWWGTIMIAVGLFYTLRFHPYRVKGKAKLEGDELGEPLV